MHLATTKLDSECYQDALVYRTSLFPIGASARST